MDCLDKILDFYNNRDTEQLRDIRIRLGKILIKLMDDLKEPNNLDSVQNCLILLINLFFDIKAPDYYHLQGKSRNEFTEDDLNKINELLRAELNNFNLN